MTSTTRTADIFPIASHGDSSESDSAFGPGSALLDEALDNTLKWRRLVHAEAKKLVAVGLHVLPVKRLAKGFPGRGMNANAASNDPVKIDEWFDPDKGLYAGGNLAVACGARDGVGVTCIDADRHGRGDGVQALQKLVDEHGNFGRHFWAKTPNDGEHHFFKWSPSFERKLTSSVQMSGLEVLGGTESEFKSFALVYPSVVKTQDGKYRQYQWQVDPVACSLREIPEWFVREFDKGGPRGSGRGNEHVGDSDLNQPVPLAQVERMLASIDPDQLDYEEWLRVGMALHSNDQSSESFLLWDEWSQRGDRYKPDECTNRWRGFKAGEVTIGSLFHYASQAEWKPEAGDLAVSEARLRIEELNRQYAFMVIGGQGRILRELHLPPQGHLHYDLLSESAFNGLLAADRMQIGEKAVPTSKIWMTSPHRRVYENGLGLYPSGSPPPGTFNTWADFAYDPVPGDCNLFLDHILNVICSGDVGTNTWVLDWLADLVQDPANPKGTALVMRGPEGSGKGTLANTMCRLFGPHAVHLIDEKHLTGNFNAHLIDAVVVFADEITWGGNKKTDGKLKGLVSEQYLIAERKGIDAVQYRNHAHVIVASNSDWVIPAGAGSRRWTVVDVDGSKCSSREYFGPIYKQLENGGYAAVLDFLLKREVTSNLRVPHVTAALQEQRALSANTRDKLFEFLQDWLSRGEIDSFISHEHSDHGMCVAKNDLYKMYRDYAKEQGGTLLSGTTFWTKFLKVFPNARAGQREWPRAVLGGQRKPARLAVLGSRDAMVRQFVRHFGVGSEDIENATEHWEVIR